MKRAGDVVRSAQGLAIVRCPDEEHPDIGAEVVDERLSDVGRVVDVFGPVERPYLAVTPDSGTPADLLGAKLYTR
ncbi:H/ACA RNA-protein complex protein Gar1 [Halarchaeum sp. CBA1220]|uniref:H/ACA RNA-protein complex protein Gar1 n=1 Tax=Halarchaeum grantii TaxID=1193105 RepID=A0A830EXU3_9EURY|nr:MULTISPECIES: Gar1/Naf1 family protein [Halarchaeum]QLC34299.1 H/ACA RNA-protein complex protein Gar1 [Halarchaeum sp. CBA1220]GGL21260.1 H/ACA RNA-protein complex protein Gar1 [Halarchaeum grantii]